MSLLDRTLEVLRSRRSQALDRGIEIIGVIGSVARGDAGPQSDVDVAYGIVGRPTLFDLGRLMADLEDDLGRRIDLVDLKTVRPRTRARMEQDLVRL